MIRKKRRTNWTSNCRHLPSSRPAPRPSPTRNPSPDRSGNPRRRHRSGPGDSTTAPPAPGPGGPPPFIPARSLSFVCPFGFPREPRSQQRILRTPAHEGDDAGVFNAERRHDRTRASSGHPCRAGAVLEKPLPVNQRARAPRPAVGYKLEDFAGVNGIASLLRRSLESAKSLKSLACVWTVTRPVHDRLTKRIHLFHGASGSEGLDLRKGAHPVADKARQAPWCGRCGRITAPP